MSPLKKGKNLGILITTDFFHFSKFILNVPIKKGKNLGILISLCEWIINHGVGCMHAGKKWESDLLLTVTWDQIWVFLEIETHTCKL